MRKPVPGAAARPLALAIRGRPNSIGTVGQQHAQPAARRASPRARRVDGDDGRVELLGDVGKRRRHRRRRSRSAGGAQRRHAAPARRRLRRRRRHRARQDEADQERHGRGQARPSRPGTAGSLRIIISLRDQESGASGFRNQRPEQRRFIQHRHAERRGLVGLAARLGADDHGRRLLADRAGDLAAQPLERGRRPPRASSTPACR